MFSNNGSLNFTPFKPIMALIVLLCGLLGFSLWTMVEETDRIDERRARVSVSAAIFGHAENMTKVIQKDIETAAGATALANSATNPMLFEQAWGAPTQTGRFYDLVFTLNADNSIGIAYERGTPSAIDYRHQFGDALTALLKNVRSKKSAASTGLIQTRRGLAITSVVSVPPPASPAQTGLAAAPHKYLVVARYVTPELLKEMGKDQWIYGLHSGQPRDGEASTTLMDAAGDPVVTLSWRPVHPGQTALQDSALFLLIGVALFLGVAFFLSRQGIAIIRTLNHSAYTDSLSQLPNRRALHRDINAQYDHTPHVALAFLDLDGFKGVNDFYGHGVGDQLIKRCAALLTELCSDRFAIYRLGGDEFAILADGEGAEENIEDLCNELLDRLARPFQIDSRTIMIGCSIGLAKSDNGWMKSTEMLRRADIAMYAAKSAGKMRVRWFDPQFDEVKKSLHKMETALRGAIEGEQFTVVYQPLVDSTGQTVVAVEALLRWTKADGTMVSPIEFIPVAEETGLINDIGSYVLRRACVDAMEWPNVQLSVNVSPVQLRNPDFTAILSNVLTQTGFPASRLELEVTETYLVVDPDTARRTLDAIHALGVKTALDDFGTGFASIGFLRKFDFDKLKIDRSLVVEAAENSASRALLQASVAMARALNMAVTAEGVENQAQADLARIAGCDQLQGWLYYRALPADAITAQLAPPTRARQLFMPQSMEETRLVA
jgi:diguanylate cyclase (GGDEF)-like protein